ncbi:MAG: hypothetical protein MUE46_01695 [Xanthomonadales bacterium]|jgi:hypothetical protein|nr:hypothetical protein [Xanthomonadales bacterium]
MPHAIRLVLACLAGILVAMLVIAGIQAIGHQLMPPPPGLAEAQGDALAALMATMPVEAFVPVLVGYLLGAEFGAIVATLISRRPVLATAIVGAVLLGATAANLTLLPHPTWMAIASVIAVVAGSVGGGFTAWALGRARAKRAGGLR